MPTFDFPLLAWWGLPLAAAPLVIHLINLLRQRRVPFPALEFLVESRRRARARVLLREWLLLAVRTAAIVGVVLALAQPRWDGRGGPFGAGSTCHLVVIDDSYSMGDLAGAGGIADVTAFDRACRAAERIAADLASGGVAGELAVLRGSQCGPDAGSRPAPARRPLGPDTARLVRDELAAAAPAAVATGPGPALAVAADLLASGTAGPAVLWLASDFRTRDWTSCADATAALERLAAAGVGIRFIDCAANADPAATGNLTVESLRVAGGVPAAGVLVPFEATVRNDGPAPARDVPLAIREDGGERPGLTIPEIPPGGVAAARFEARFPAAGDHVVAVTLAGDRLPADDARATVIDVREAADVLVVDGDPRGSGRAGDAFYLAAAWRRAPARPRACGHAWSRPALAELELAAFDSIWLLDVARLDPAEVTALEAYVRAGGGVAFFVGPRTAAAETNRSLHRDGAGVFPVALAEPTDLPAAADAAARQPDVRADDHPVVAVLSGQRNPLLDAVRVDRFMAVDEGSGPAARRLLSLRTGAPLAVERPCGAGLAVAVLTTAAPTWNNWARGNPSWVVTMLELESHLARSRRQARSVAVGAAVSVRLADAAAPEVDFSVPPTGAVERVAAVPDAGGELVATLPRTASPGVVVARWSGADGDTRERLTAVNVDPAEGRLARIDRDGLARAVGGLPFSFDRAESPTLVAAPAAGTGWTRPLAAGLLILLLAEQLLAERASDHPAPRPRRGRAQPA